MEIDKIVVKQGLTGKDAKSFSDLLLKANIPQLIVMKKNIVAEIEKRGLR